MTDLLRADLVRLWKSRVFLACLAVAAGIEAAVVLNGCRQAKLLAAEGYLRSLDDYYFGAVVVLGLFIALVMGLFLGTEYNDGTIRNKLVVGRTRREVYLSGLMTGVVAATLLTLVMFLAGLVGVPGLGLWKIGLQGAALHFLVALTSSVALASLFTLVGMLSEKKSTTAVTALLLFVALFLFSTWIYSRLNEPPMNSGILITASGMELAPETPNPNYVGGVLRQVLQALVEILPTGQTCLILNGALTRPLFNAAASAVLTVLTTGVGMALFQKKDLK